MRAVHRDLKPGNVHLGNDGVLRILDFGAVKHISSSRIITERGLLMGTYAHMAPEQLREGGNVTFAADLWQLGVLLYQLLSGVHPFAYDGFAPSRQQIIGDRILREAPHPLEKLDTGAPAFLLDLVQKKMLRKDPAHRHTSAEQLAWVLTGAMKWLDDNGHGGPSLVELGAKFGHAPAAFHPGSAYATLSAEEDERLARVPPMTFVEVDGMFIPRATMMPPEPRSFSAAPVKRPTPAPASTAAPERLSEPRRTTGFDASTTTPPSLPVALRRRRDRAALLAMIASLSGVLVAVGLRGSAAPSRVVAGAGIAASASPTPVEQAPPMPSATPSALPAATPIAVTSASATPMPRTRTVKAAAPPKILPPADEAKPARVVDVVDPWSP